MNIAILGTGYVGLVTGVCFADFGIQVTCIDRDTERIAELDAGRVPFHEPRLTEMLHKAQDARRIQFTADPAAVGDALVVFIAVGTPSGAGGLPDLQDVDASAHAIGRHLDGYKVVVIKSTVPVGTGRRVSHILRQHHPGGVVDVASNPEFLREGSAIEDFLRPNRVVIGAESPQAAAILRDLYRPLYLIETPFVVTTIETAELIKYACNAFLAIKVSFVNEMAGLCERLGADVHVVARAMGLDQRIGPKFLHAGPGFGGSCFPKDARAVAALGRLHDWPSLLVEAAIDVNERQARWMVDKIVAALGPGSSAGRLDGLTVGLLGLAFKPNTDDVREAPALRIVQEIRARGAQVQAHDPAAMSRAARVCPEIAYRRDAYEAAEHADALVLVTEWNQFRNLDFDRLKAVMRRPLLLDLRNVYEPEQARAAGFEYEAVGRSQRATRTAGAVSGVDRPS